MIDRTYFWSIFSLAVLCALGLIYWASDVDNPPQSRSAYYVSQIPVQRNDAVKFPWTRPDRTALTQKAKALSPGDTLDTVLKVLGPPSYARRMVSVRVIGRKDRGFILTYYLFRIDKLGNMCDDHIMLVFSNGAILNKISIAERSRLEECKRIIALARDSGLSSALPSKFGNR